MANRAELEAKARELNIKIDDKWSDARLNDEIVKAGVEAQNSTPDQGGARFAEPQGTARFVPVDEPAEFKPDPEQDKIKTSSKPKVKLFPVKLVKNYRPISPEAQIQDETTGEYRPLSEDEAAKVEAGKHLALPVEEAQSVIEKKIAERNDPIA